MCLLIPMGAAVWLGFAFDSGWVGLGAALVLGGLYEHFWGEGLRCSTSDDGTLQREARVPICLLLIAGGVGTWVGFKVDSFWIGLLVFLIVFGELAEAEKPQSVPRGKGGAGRWGLLGLLTGTALVAWMFSDDDEA
ncbi:hypothetical protein JCM17960_22630 [Magnetospira thiophila]